MTYKPGDRVIVNIPAPTVGVVRSLTVGGMVVVDAGGTTGTLAVSEMRPAMPRDEGDLERWGRWWWRGERPVLVERRDDGWMVWRDEPKRSWPVVAPSCDWRGPVVPPPEVRP